MIQPNELRIGNLVIWDRTNDIEAENEIVEIYNITRSSIRAYTDIEELPEILIYYEDIKPIPLTPEWLTRAGFEKNIYGYYVYDILEIGHTTTEEYFELELKGTNDDVGYKLIAIKYVHQLQNLYFALTGTELEFK